MARACCADEVSIQNSFLGLPEPSDAGGPGKRFHPFFEIEGLALPSPYVSVILQFCNVGILWFVLEFGKTKIGVFLEPLSRKNIRKKGDELPCYSPRRKKVRVLLNTH